MKKEEETTFLCDDCHQVKPTKECCAGKLGKICTSCFDKRLTQMGNIAKVCDSLCWQGKI